MDIFVGIVEDSHIDVDVQVFISADAAITWARNLAKASTSGRIDEVELNDAMKADGWVYCAYYSGEGDLTRVVRRSLDSAVGGR